MSLLDEWIKKGAEKADEALEREGEKGVGKLLDSLEDALPAHGDPDVNKATIRGMSLDAIGRARKHAPALVGLSRRGLAVVVTFMAQGREADAIEAYVRERAQPQDLVAMSLAASDAAVAERQEREATLEALKQQGLSFLRELGPVAARYLLPLLLTAL